MTYMIGLAAMLIVLGLLPQQYGLQQKNHKMYLIVGGVLITLIMGLRSMHTGSGDTYVYAWRYKYYQGFDAFQEYYDLDLADNHILMSEAGFHWCVFIMGRIFDDPQVLIFTSSLFITYSVCRFIYKNSSDGFLSLLVYTCLGMFTFNMNGMRQALAMAVCLFAFERAKKQKLISFVIVVLIAMQFHKTAICFFPVFFLPKVKNTKGNILLYVGGIMVFLLALDSLILTYNDMSGKEYGTDSSIEGGGLFVVLLYLFGLILTLIQKNAIKDKKVAVPLLGTIAGLAAYVARYFSNQMMERISYYFFYFLILLIPEAILHLSERDRKIVRWLFIVFAFALFSYRIYNGSFRDFTLYFQ